MPPHHSFDCASFNEILIIFCIKSEVLTLLEGGILAQNRTQLIVNFNHILTGFLSCPCPGGLQSLSKVSRCINYDADTMLHRSEAIWHLLVQAKCSRYIDVLCFEACEALLLGLSGCSFGCKCVSVCRGPSGSQVLALLQLAI